MTMGAWLFFLTVLATLKPIVQVASTNGETSTSLTYSTSLSSSSSSPLSIPFPVIDTFNSNKNKLSDSNNSDLSRRKVEEVKAMFQVNSRITAPTSMEIENEIFNISPYEDVVKKQTNQNDINTNDQNEINNNLINSYSDTSIVTAKKPDPDTLVEIENSLLSLFNMKRPPKIDRTKIIIPDAMKKLYAQIMGEELDSVNIPKPGLLTKSANTVRSFTHQDSKIDDRFPYHHRFRLHFSVNTIPSEEKLKAAELSLSRDAIRGMGRAANRSYYQVLIYDILKVGVKGKREPVYLLLDSKQVRLNSTETVSFDVQPAVDRWLSTPKNNNGLLVEVRTAKNLKPAPHHHVRLRRSANESPEVWSHKQPLLFTYTDDGRHKSRSIRDMSRPKRAHHARKSNRRKNNEEICRRHSLYVDFADVGWSDWIVAPPGYDAYYCHGKCPFPLVDHLNTTNHAVIQTLVNNIHPGKVPKPCCVPTQLSSTSMLYLNDENSVVLKSYQDMTVIGCGCR